MRTRDLARLFEMLVMPCPDHNRLMRKAVVEARVSTNKKSGMME